MGSWSFRADGIFDYWSPETFVNFGFDPDKGIPTLSQWLDVLQDEATKAESKSGLPMFGDQFVA